MQSIVSAAPPKNQLLQTEGQITSDSMFSTLVGATTAEDWTTTPRNANYHPSPRSAISARASTTWLPTAQSKHNSPHQVLRENRPPRKETRRSTATRHRLPRPLIKREIGQHWRRGSTEANHTALMGRWDTRAPSSYWSCFWNYLRLKKIAYEECCWSFFLFVFIWCNTQEYCCIIALRTLFKCLNHCCSFRDTRL